LRSRGFEASETEVDLLLRGGSIPSGVGLRIFYRNQCLQEMINGGSGIPEQLSGQVVIAFSQKYLIESEKAFYIRKFLL